MIRLLVVLLLTVLPLHTDIRSLQTPTYKMVDIEYMRRILTGRIDYRGDANFVKVQPEHTVREMYLEQRTYNAFLHMHAAALADGIRLTIISGARNFDYQRRIWEGKWSSLRGNSVTDKASSILRYSSMPSTSRHHWGTDIDLNRLDNGYFEQGKGLEEYEWLCANASRFGFCQVYTHKAESGRTGYEMEKWHWSYMPVASGLLWHYIRLINHQDIKQFSGAEVASELDIIGQYVLGISSCN
ncbi:MAG: M15 family metallopeptidase [Tenuifilaceae bacterium]|nr:M15 family metallopeptidase [Tenuifilaceae bacterium]